MHRNNEKEGTMHAKQHARRELAHRVSDTLQVSLFWTKATNRVTVAVLDERLDECFEVEVDANNALDAFHHPYAYATARALDLCAASPDALAA